MSPEFLVTSFVVVLAPGTGVLFTLAMGLSKGVRASIAAAFGCTLGIVPHMAAAILGLAALLHASATAFQMLKIAGVIYLLYLAWTMLRERGALSVPPEGEAREEAARHGIPEGLIRYSTGIEETADLIADLDQALAAR